MQIEENIRQKLKRLLAKLKKSDFNRFSKVTLRGLIQLLPGGSLFDAWMYELDESKELDLALTLLASSIQEIGDKELSEKDIKRLNESIASYLVEFERMFNLTIDSSNKAHDEILLLLKQIVPPNKISEPTIFLFSGPSASGKDSLLESIRKSLRSRGYGFEYLLKYTTRKKRKSEINNSYYRYLSKKEFQTKIGEGEITLNYSKYGYDYGLSKSQLMQNSEKKIPTFGIISDFRRMKETVETLRKKNIRVVNVLIYATAEDCRRRMPHRNLEPTDTVTRIQEAEEDCLYIESNFETIENSFNFILLNNDKVNFSSASAQLYNWIEGCLRSEIN